MSESPARAQRQASYVVNGLTLGEICTIIDDASAIAPEVWARIDEVLSRHPRRVQAFPITERGESPFHRFLAGEPLPEDEQP